MENNNSKIITVCFLSGGILVGFIFSVVLETLAAISTGAAGRILGQDLVRHGVPVLLGGIFFVVMQFNARILAWADEVVSEIRKVVWPSRKDTASMTVVVCIMLLISGLALGLLDMVSGSLIDWLLQRNIMGLL